MIYRTWQDKPELELLGKHIFHKTKGGIPLIGTYPYGDTNIGEYLGKVTEVNGTNRIYYLNGESIKKYVSIVGIGFVCENDFELEHIQTIKDKALTKFKKSMSEISQDMLEAINDFSK
ncbi:hypothetical protein H4J57_09240 [Colwellia sp. BRX8-7]|jgi:hypothetical protein|uniref:hypothetical protein n=1 Tax=Colwellia sp. BRX8-7 TaxID=2759833 RepID=UPI0015F72EAE|nr:hypothetical protein [Colwellia sp. BRX8-7]MBA6337384.1 hypothetical protein [Colwellia sp. BRX8-7]